MEGPLSRCAEEYSVSQGSVQQPTLPAAAKRATRNRLQALRGPTRVHRLNRNQFRSLFYGWPTCHGLYRFPGLRGWSNATDHISTIFSEPKAHHRDLHVGGAPTLLEQDQRS